MTDWQPGDLALCVKGGRIVSSPLLRPPLPEYPNTGKIYTVDGVSVDKFIQVPGESVLALHFTDAPTNRCGKRVWAAERFVKVTPGADIKGVEVERKAPKPVKKSEGVVL